MNPVAGAASAKPLAGGTHHVLEVLADGVPAAFVTYESQAERYGLHYLDAWRTARQGYALSPWLPVEAPPGGHASGPVQRFLQNLLPEGRALEAALARYAISRSNVFALVRALGRETAGALAFDYAGEIAADDAAELAKLEERSSARRGARRTGSGDSAATAKRHVSREELRARILDRERTPLALWDGKVRLSMPGLQDKLPVYIDAAGEMYLVEPPFASTHILKPEPGEGPAHHLVANEHYCMQLARAAGLATADVRILRLPEPVLVVERFDRERTGEAGVQTVRKHHIIDGCQAADTAAAAKYEHNFGRGPDVAHIRDGVSFERLFAAVRSFGTNKAATRLALLRWAIYTLITGNTDAHGKNFSFHVAREGIAAAPGYDLVSVVQYGGIDHELAMAFGDEFDCAAISAFALADFTRRTDIPRALLSRELVRMGRAVIAAAPALATSDAYVDEEREIVQRVAGYCMAEARRLIGLAGEVTRVRKDLF